MKQDRLASKTAMPSPGRSPGYYTKIGAVGPCLGPTFGTSLPHVGTSLEDQSEDQWEAVGGVGQESVVALPPPIGSLSSQLSIPMQVKTAQETSSASATRPKASALHKAGLLLLGAAIGVGILFVKMNPPMPISEAAIAPRQASPQDVPALLQHYVDAGMRTLQNLENSQQELLDSTTGGLTSGGNGTQDDEEWATLPRSKYDFVEELSYRPGQLRLNLLYRHPQLNPADTYIPPYFRQKLGSVYQAGVAEYLELSKLTGDASREEFFAQKKANQVRRVSIDDLAREKLYGEDLDDYLKKRAAGSIVYQPSFFPQDRQPMQRTFEGDGTLLYAFAEDLPASNQLYQLEKHAKITLAAAVFSFFSAHASLPDSQQLTFLEEISENLHL